MPTCCDRLRCTHHSACGRRCCGPSPAPQACSSAPPAFVRPTPAGACRSTERPTSLHRNLLGCRTLRPLSGSERSSRPFPLREILHGRTLVCPRLPCKLPRADEFSSLWPSQNSCGSHHDTASGLGLPSFVQLRPRLGVRRLVFERGVQVDCRLRVVQCVSTMVSSRSTSAIGRWVRRFNAQPSVGPCRRLLRAWPRQQVWRRSPSWPRCHQRSQAGRQKSSTAPSAQAVRVRTTASDSR